MRMLFQLLCEDDEVVDIETSIHGKYQRPYNIEELKKYYPDKVDILLSDPVHRWRATTGIEQILFGTTVESNDQTPNR